MHTTRYVYMEKARGYKESFSIALIIIVVGGGGGDMCVCVHSKRTTLWSLFFSFFFMWVLGI